MAGDAVNLKNMSEEEAVHAVYNGALRDAIGLEPGDLDFGLTLAKNKLEAGHAKDALSLYAFMVTCEPSNFNYMVGLANCASQMGLHDLSLRAAAALIAGHPREGRGYYFSGKACLAMGLLDEAEIDFEDAMRLAQEADDKTIVARSALMLGQIRALRTQGSA